MIFLSILILISQYLISNNLVVVGLFHKAIAQSGVAINPWSSMPKDSRKKAYRLCSLLGNKTEDNQEVFSFLKTVDVQQLIEAQNNILTNRVKTLFYILHISLKLDDVIILFVLR